MVDNTAENQSRRRPRRSAKKRKTDKEAWLSSRIVRAIKKMKIAGLRHALKPGVDLIERLWWIGVFFLCLGYTAFLTVQTVIEYSENPILHTFDDDEPIYNVLFPSATMTGTMIFRNNTIVDSSRLYREKLKSDAEEFEFDEKTWSHPLVDLLIVTIDHFCGLVKSFATRTGIMDEQRLEEFKLRQHQDWSEAKEVKLRDNVGENGIKSNIIPFLKQKTLDCRNILAACMWEGKNRNCTELFVPIQTDVGTGCSFNRIPESLLRKNRGFMSLFDDHKYPDAELKAWTKFAKERMDSVMTAGGLQDFINMMHPRKQRHGGKLRGLSFMVKFDENTKGMSCPIVDSYGYLLAIHSPFEEPQMLHTGVTIPPSHEIFVNVNAEVTIADKEIENLHMSKRNCYFQKENPLENFQVYTLGNCHQECLGKTIQNACNCTLLTLSGGKNETICGPTKTDCVQNARANLEEGRYDELCVNPACHPPCNDVKYRPDASYLPYYKETGFKQERDQVVTSIIHVAFDSNSVSTRRKKLQLKFSILVGVLGGTWGMTLEFSIFTIFNVLAGLGVLLFSKYLKVEEDENLDFDEEAPEEMSSCDEDDSRNDEELTSVEIENENDQSHGFEEIPGEMSPGSNEASQGVHEPPSYGIENENDQSHGFEEIPGEMSPGSNEASQGVHEPPSYGIENENDQSHGFEEIPGEMSPGSNEASQGVHEPPSYGIENENDVQALGDTAEERGEELFQPGNDADNRVDQELVLHEAASGNDHNTHDDKEVHGERLHGIDDSKENLPHTACDKILEESNEFYDSVEELSSTVSDIIAESSSSSDSPAMENESATTPTPAANDVNDNVDNAEANQPPDDESVSTEQKSAENESDTSIDLKEECNQPADEETVLSTEPNVSVAGNLEVPSQSGPSLQEPMDWDKVLDELLELVEL